MSLEQEQQDFVDAIRADLEQNGRDGAVPLLDEIAASAAERPEVGELLAAWAGGGSTLALFRLSDLFGDRARNDYFNKVAALDSASLHVRLAAEAEKTEAGRDHFGPGF